MKKILSFLLAMVLLSGTLSVAVNAESALMVSVTVSYYGEFATTIQNEPAALLPVFLNEDSECTLDDVFRVLHECYQPDGYSSASSAMGGYITKFWNDTSGNFGYQINGTMPSDLFEPVANGDIIDVAIYKNLFPHTEAYTRFDHSESEVTTGEPLTLTLSESAYQQGEDGIWSLVYFPCTEASILVNGEETGLLTDADGKAELVFDEEGTYLVSAYKEKTISEDEPMVPAITAPACVVTVTATQDLSVIHNIAKAYSGDALATDVNMIWLLCDLAVYNELYPDTRIVLSDNIKQACLDTIIKSAAGSEDPSVAAKSILALRAMGYDVKTVCDELGNLINLPEKLGALIDADVAALDNVYSMPYIIFALSQCDEYATDSRVDALLQKAISKKAEWQTSEWGTDAMSAMIPALAIYRDQKPELDSLISETLDIISQAQSDTGLIDNACATGLAMVAFSSIGTNPATVLCNDNSLIDGLLTQQSEEKNAFLPMENSFSTEQGWRGLLAWQLYEQGTGKLFYDYSDFPANAASCTKKQSTPVFVGGGGGGGGFVTTQKDNNNEKEPDKTDEKSEEELLQEEKQSKIKENRNPDVKQKAIVAPGKTFADISEHPLKKQIEALAQRGIINGKTEHSYDATASMTRAEFAALVSRALGLSKSEPHNFSDVTPNDWFYDAVGTAYHYGIIKGISETAFQPNGTITRQEAAVMVSRAAKLCGLSSSVTDARDILAAFTDYMSIASWAKEDMAFCYEEGILPETDLEVLAETVIDRGAVADMVYRLLKNSFLLEETASDETK